MLFKACPVLISIFDRTQKFIFIYYKSIINEFISGYKWFGLEQREVD